MSKITYADKSDITTTQTPATNKVSGSDMNEIKSVVNDNFDLLEYESGSNTNGDYIKFADGTMICYGEKSGDATWSDYWGFCKRTPDSSSSAITATFPETFISAPIVQLTGSHTGYIFSANVFSVDTTTLKVVLFKPTNATGTNYKYSWLAIGKWK